MRVVRSQRVEYSQRFRPYTLRFLASARSRRSKIWPSRRTDAQGACPCQISPPSFGSKDLASERPILCVSNQSASNGILQDISGLLFGAFARTNCVMERASLPSILPFTQFLCGE